MDVRDLNMIWGGMDSVYQSWQPHFRDVAQAFDPGRQRFELSNTNRKINYNNSIIDPTVTMNVRTLSAGLMAGVTNPSVPWIKLETQDDELNKSQRAKVWFHEVGTRILRMLARSNFYNVVPMIYSDLGMYSTASMQIEADPFTGLRFYHKPVGTYRIANGPRLTVDTWASEHKLTAQQIVGKFGMDSVSMAVRQAYEQRDVKTLFSVRHLVAPREYYDPNKQDGRNMPIKSVWWQVGEDDILSESGFKQLPTVTPRWEVVGNDSFGSFGPGMLALGSARGLQKDHRQRFEAQDKMLNPPLNVPSSLRNSRASLVPGGINYVPDSNMGSKIEPVFNMNYPINYALQSVDDTRMLLRQAFFTDLFLAITNIQKSNVTATEIAQRQEEKLLMLGPVLNRINEEFLDPVIERAFQAMTEAGALPPPPPELEGKDIRIEYVSMLHQAQKMVGIAGIERSVSFIGNLAGAKPEALDKINVDATIDEYVSITGANPIILNDEQTVAQIRQARQQQMQAQQLGAAAGPMEQTARAAELLSKTDVGGGSALDAIRSNLAG